MPASTVSATFLGGWRRAFASGIAALHW